jgi:hypothetical protein
MKQTKKIEIDPWWLRWMGDKVAKDAHRYDVDALPFGDKQTVKILEALERVFEEHGAEPSFQLQLPRKGDKKDGIQKKK